MSQDADAFVQTFKDILNECTELKEKVIQMDQIIREKDAQIQFLNNELNNKITSTDEANYMLAKISEMCDEKETKFLTGLWNLTGSKQISIQSLSRETNICESLMLMLKSKRNPHKLLPTLGLIANLCSESSFRETYGAEIIESLIYLTNGKLTDYEFEIISEVLLFCILNLSKSPNLMKSICINGLLNVVRNPKYINQKQYHQNINRILSAAIYTAHDVEKEEREQILNSLNVFVSFEFVPVSMKREIASMIYGYE